MQHHIKANLTYNAASYQSGNGEGVWVIVDEDVFNQYQADATGAGYTCELDNDACYYLGLYAGEQLPLELRGDKRPVVPYEYLVARWPLNPEWVDA